MKFLDKIFCDGFAQIKSNIKFFDSQKNEKTPLFRHSVIIDKDQN
jgi:hypothetical protein